MGARGHQEVLGTSWGLGDIMGDMRGFWGHGGDIGDVGCSLGKVNHIKGGFTSALVGVEVGRPWGHHGGLGTSWGHHEDIGGLADIMGVLGTSLGLGDVGSSSGQVNHIKGGFTGCPRWR